MNRCYRCNGSVLIERGNATYGEPDEWVCLSCSRAQTPGKSLPIDANLPPRHVVGYMGTSSKMRTCMDCKGPLSDRNATNRCAVRQGTQLTHIGQPRGWQLKGRRAGLEPLRAVRGGNEMSIEQTQIAKHTPGPWSYEDGDGDQFWVHGYDESMGYVGVRGEANARLIAAAPELLRELEDLHRYFTDSDFRADQDARAAYFTDGNVGALECILDSAERAIAKARGGAAW